jgi:hypothetical protein
MPKVQKGKRNNAHADAAAKTRAAHSIFKMNTDIGQHVLKNPGIAQAIVDKAELKQSDVCLMEAMRLYILRVHANDVAHCRLFSKSVPVQVT